MQVLSVVGDGADRVVDDLSTRLDGRVAVVRRADSGGRRVARDGGAATVERATPEVDTAYELAADGSWSAAGVDRDFPAVLDSLAPEHDYALAAGFSELRLPTALVGDVDERDVPGDVVASAPSADELDLDGLAADLDGFEPHVTLEALVERAKRSPLAERSGAIATFTGRVRAKDSEDDAPTEQLAFEKYEGVAEERLAVISEELTAREGVFEVLMHHRVGVVANGEDIVFVVVLAGHREEAFRAVEDGINRLKEEVPIFKKETTAEEEFWVHQRE